ncbi:MAG: hypothetical protein HYX24_04540 [Candidatus Aenigmarchaeota archaeon]|nr:hypothetical protein [Candidatus Aenigmarchaeota archaeon]
MSLEKLAEDISKESKSEAEKHIKEARQEALRLESESKNRLEEKKAELKREHDEMLSRAMAKEMGLAEIGRRKIVLQEKRKLVDSLYRDFLSSRKAQAFEKLCEIGKKLFPQAKAAYVSRSDMKHAARLLPRIKIKESAMQGLVLESGDGKESLNLSMDVIMEAFKARTIKKAYQSLFSR